MTNDEINQKCQEALASELDAQLQANQCLKTEALHAQMTPETRKALENALTEAEKVIKDAKTAQHIKDYILKSKLDAMAEQKAQDAKQAKSDAHMQGWTGSAAQGFAGFAGQTTYAGQLGAAISSPESLPFDKLTEGQKISRLRKVVKRQQDTLSGLTKRVGDLAETVQHLKSNLAAHAHVDGHVTVPLPPEYGIAQCYGGRDPFPEEVTKDYI